MNKKRLKGISLFASAGIGETYFKDIGIDIVVANAEPNLGSQIDSLFSWSGNNCLSSAVRNVLQHCNPQGSCVYSYFIRMNQ